MTYERIVRYWAIINRQNSEEPEFDPHRDKPAGYEPLANRLYASIIAANNWRPDLGRSMIRRWVYANQDLAMPANVEAAFRVLITRSIDFAAARPIMVTNFSILYGDNLSSLIAA